MAAARATFRSRHYATYLNVATAGLAGCHTNKFRAKALVEFLSLVSRMIPRDTPYCLRTERAEGYVTSGHTQP